MSETEQALEGSKICNVCGLLCLLSDCRGSRCKKCIAEWYHQDYLDNADQRKIKAKKWYTANRVAAKLRNREWAHRAQINQPLLIAFYSAKYRAKKNGIPFNLEYEDLLPVPAVCPVLGIPIIHGTGKRTDNSPSIDKIIPSLGYVVGNVCVISFRANRIKADASLEEILLVSEYIKRKANV